MSKKSIIKKQKLKQKAKKQNAMKKIAKAEEAPILTRDFISLKANTSSQVKKVLDVCDDLEKNSDLPTLIRPDKKKRRQIQAEYNSNLEVKGNEIPEEKNKQKPKQEKTEAEDNRSNETGIKNKKKQKQQDNHTFDQEESKKQKHSTKHQIEDSLKSEEPPKKKSKVSKNDEVVPTETLVTEADAEGEKDSTEEIQPTKSAQRKKKEKPESHYTIFVGNLSYSTTKEDLEQFFSKVVPEVKSVRLPTDKATGKPRGIAFIEVDGEKNYQAALSLDKSFMKDRRINVEYTCAGSKKGKHRKGIITAKNLKFKDLKRRGIMTPGARPPPSKYKFKPHKK